MLLEDRSEFFLGNGLRHRRCDRYRDKEPRAA
uniref:Uncharacterized protein n=1 Tax=Anopheles albimanus TaxID=7167 RepID=A0A182FY95_ANOAL